MSARAIQGAMKSKAETRPRTQLIAGVVIVAVVLLMFALYLGLRVCDDEVTSAGKVVKACRHLQATDAPFLALGGILLVALGAFFTEISVFGFTVKRELEAVKERQDETDEKVEKTAERLDETAEDAADFHARMLAHEIGPRVLSERSAALAPDIAELAERYNELRWTMPSGPARNVQMNGVVREMRNVLRDTAGFDVRAHLSDHNRGVRLAAFAYLNEREEPEVFDVLVDAVLAEDKPFGQFWGLRAVVHQLAGGRARLDEDARHKLNILRGRLGPDTDRAQVLRQILG